MAIAILLAALGAVLAACGERRPEEVTHEKPPVIIISIDTLRADHLPMFGYRQVETPNLDALRADGILYTNAWSHVPLTLPSHASILTGQLPQNNGVRNNIGYHLDEKVVTIPAMLRNAGYVSGAAVSSYVIRRATGLANGFDSYDDAIENRPGTTFDALQRPGAITTRVAKSWIEKNDSKPFFFLLHLFEPHSPYTPPEPFRSRYAFAYDGEIATVDALVGEFIADLKSRGIYDRALVIFLSDHGEGLSQHGEPEHGIFLYRETTHVPLVVKLPGNARAGETEANPVGLVDILSTIAEVTGVRSPGQIDGVSLLAPTRADRTIYSETLYPRIHLGTSELRALEGQRYHFIRAPRSELYDMASDPGETRNILGDERRVYNAMRAALDKYGSSVVLPSNIDPEEAKKLAALGYLGTTQPAAGGPLPDPKDRIGEVADLARANALLRDGDLTRGVALLRRIVERNPRFSDAWNQLAVTLEKEGDLEGAATAYSAVMRNVPEIAGDFALPLGTIFLRLGRLDDAVAHARLAEASNPGPAHILKALIALARRRPDEAETEARSARGEPATFLEASVLLAGIMAGSGRTAEALAILDEAEQRARETAAGPVASLDTVRGGILMRMGDVQGAIVATRRATAAFPADRAAWSQLAAIYAQSGRRGEAAAAIDEFIAANRGPDARRYGAQLRVQLGL